MTVDSWFDIDYQYSKIMHLTLRAAHGILKKNHDRSAAKLEAMPAAESAFDSRYIL